MTLYERLFVMLLQPFLSLLSMAFVLSFIPDIPLDESVLNMFNQVVIYGNGVLLFVFIIPIMVFLSIGSIILYTTPDETIIENITAFKQFALAGKVMKVNQNQIQIIFYTEIFISILLFYHGFICSFFCWSGMMILNEIFRYRVMTFYDKYDLDRVFVNEEDTSKEDV